MQPTQPNTIFYSYAHQDESLRDELEKHLKILVRQGVIETWHFREISAGEEWAGAIDEHLERAAIILLLVSADFLASDYCWDVELKRAMERHQAGEARVIPVILRAVDWQGAPFGVLQALPKNARPVTSWENIDEAFTDVARGIRTAVKAMSTPPTTEKVSPPGSEVGAVRQASGVGREAYTSTTTGKGMPPRSITDLDDYPEVKNRLVEILKNYFMESLPRVTVIMQASNLIDSTYWPDAYKDNRKSVLTGHAETDARTLVEYAIHQGYFGGPSGPQTLLGNLLATVRLSLGSRDLEFIDHMIQDFNL